VHGSLSDLFSFKTFAISLAGRVATVAAQTE